MIKLNKVKEQLDKLGEEKGKELEKTHAEIVALEYFTQQSTEYLSEYNKMLDDRQFDKNGETEVEVDGKLVKKTRKQLTDELLESLSVSKLYKAVVDNNRELGKLKLEKETIKNEIYKLESEMFGEDRDTNELKKLRDDLESKVEEEIQRRKVHNEKTYTEGKHKYQSYDRDLIESLIKSR
jgi:pyrimidine deaminase RibD-like protein